MTQAYNLSQFANKVNTSGLADLATAVTGILPVANGGTGASSLTANGVIIGNGTGALSSVAPSTSGNVLTSNGSAWISTSSVPAALSTASGSAPSYSARTWINFNGTGSITIRASGNVSYLTDNGTGDYTLNFTTALPDTNYAVTTGINSASASNPARAVTIDSDGTTATLMTTTQLRLQAGSTGGSPYDEPVICIAIFR